VLLDEVEEKVHGTFEDLEFDVIDMGSFPEAEPGCCRQ